MKTRFVHSLFLTLASLLFVTTARAELLVYEPFDYDTGDIDGQNGGMGFGSEWVVNSGFTFEVVDPGGPMQYVMPGGGTISGGNRALRFGNDSFGDVLADEVDSLKREFDDIHEFDEVYISFLYRYDPEGYIDDNDFVVWWFNDRGGPQLGLKGNGGDGSLTDDFVGRVSGAFAAPQQAFVPDVDISDEAGTMGETFFLVGKMARADYSDTPLDYDEFSIWVNPSANEMNCAARGGYRCAGRHTCGLTGESWHEDIQPRRVRRYVLGRDPYWHDVGRRHHRRRRRPGIAGRRCQHGPGVQPVGSREGADCGQVPDRPGGDVGRG